MVKAGRGQTTPSRPLPLVHSGYPLLIQIFLIMFFKRNRAAKLDLDRSVLNLDNPKHPDDQILLRDLLEHILVLGSTGTGKTSTVGYYLARNILSRACPQSGLKTGMIVFQYKDDTEQWLRWAEQFGRLEDVIVIGEDDSDVFNILDAYRDMDANSAVDTLMVLSKLTLNGSSSGDEKPFWQIMNRQRLHRLVLLNQLSGESLNVLTLARIHDSAPQNEAQLHNQEFLANSACWQLLGQAQDRHGSDYPPFKLCEDYFLRRMPYLAEETASSILSMTGGILEPFLSSPVLNRLFCGETRLSLDEMLNGKIVLLNLPIQKLEYVGRIAQMLFKHVLQKRIEARDLQESPNPVIFHIDEFQHLISEHDALFMSTARSSRAGCLLMTQNISGLYGHVGGAAQLASHKVTSLLALCNHKFFLAQNDATTNEFASKIIGKGLEHMGGASIDMEQFKGSASSSESYQPLFMPNEFTMLSRGGAAHDHLVEAVVTATGKRFSNGRNFLLTRFKQPWA